MIWKLSLGVKNKKVISHPDALSRTWIRLLRSFYSQGLLNPKALLALGFGRIFEAILIRMLVSYPQLAQKKHS